MRKLGLSLSIVLVLGMVLAVSCGGGAAPAPTVTVTKTAPPVTVTIGATPGAAPTVTVTQTAPAVPAVTVTVTPTPPKLVKLTGSVSTGGAALFYFDIAKSMGFFAKRGLEVEIKEMASASASVAPFVGQVDFTTATVFGYYPERQDLRMVGPTTFLHQSVLVRKDSPYRSYRDLKGKKIGIMGPATGQYQVVKVLTKLQGLDLEKDFQLIIGESTVQTGWLLRGDVEAIHVYEPLTTKLLVSDGDKVRELHWLNALYGDLTGNVWAYGGVLVSKGWLDKNPELGRQLGRGFDEALTYAYGHPSVWKSDLAKKLWKVEDEKTLEQLSKRMPRTLAGPPYSPAYKNMLVEQAQLQADVGILSPAVVDWIKEVVVFAD